MHRIIIVGEGLGLLLNGDGRFRMTLRAVSESSRLEPESFTLKSTSA